MSESDDARPRGEEQQSEQNNRGRGHGPIIDTTIELYDGVIEAEQCENCRMKVPKDGDGFEKHSCERIQRLNAPKLITDEDRERGKA